MEINPLIKQEHNNRFIAEYLDAYRTYTDIDYAVMISGPWGCGKTHFVREYLETCRSRALDPSKNGYWYVSLHGVMSTAEIDARLYEAAHEKLGSQNAQVSYHLIRGLVEVGISVGCNVGADKVSDLLKSGGKLFRELKKFCDKSNKPSLIVFDDFERCLIDKSALLGYIGEFLKESIPVVVVGAENEIEDSLREKKKSYRRMREKMIGKTFVLREELNDLFGVLVGMHVFTNAELFLLSERENIVNDLRHGREKGWQCNYRALKHVFRELDYLLGGMKQTKAYKDANFMKNFVRVFVVLGYEIQVGTVAHEDFDSLQSGKGTLVQILQERGFSIYANQEGQPCLVLPLALLKEIFFGIIPDRKTIGAAIAALPMFNPKKEADWYRLWQWFKLPDAEAPKVISAVRKGLDGYRYLQSGEIVQIFTVLCGLAEKKAIPESIGDVKKWFTRYVNDLADQDKLFFEEELLGGFCDNWQGCMFWRLPHCRQQPSGEFVGVIQKLYAVRKNQNVQKKNDALLYGFGENVDALCSELRIEHPGRAELLEHADSKRFFEEYSGLPNESMVKIRAALEFRYRRGANPNLKVREAKFLRRFATEIRKWKVANASLRGRPSYACMDELLKIVASEVKRPSAK